MSPALFRVHTSSMELQRPSLTSPHAAEFVYVSSRIPTGALLAPRIRRLRPSTLLTVHSEGSLDLLQPPPPAHLGSTALVEVSVGLLRRKSAAPWRTSLAVDRVARDSNGPLGSPLHTLRMGCGWEARIRPQRDRDTRRLGAITRLAAPNYRRTYTELRGT